MSQPNFAISVRFEVAPENADAFQTVALRQAKNSLEKEAWCHQFVVCRDPEKFNVFMFFESYDDAEAFEKHRSTDHFADYMEKVTPWILSKELNTYDVCSFESTNESNE